MMAELAHHLIVAELLHHAMMAEMASLLDGTILEPLDGRTVASLDGDRSVA
jgi:hypothetical protein